MPNTMERTQPEAYVLAQMGVLQRILCCPRARTGLSLIPRPDLLARLSEQERTRVSAQTVGAFVSESIAVAYPIVGRIVSFLESDSLLLANAATPAPAPTAPEDETVRQSVKEWYDQFGWRKNDEGLYHDTALFSQDKPSGIGWYRLASHLSLIDRLAGGQFLLDAASGALPHPEQLAYAWYYQFRICLDISITALREAERKIGERGFCLLADICRLPFGDGTIDGIVSGYTIQHLPESQQGRAVAELFRVLRPSARLCVMTDVQRTGWHASLLLALRASRKILRGLGIARSARPAGFRAHAGAARPPHELYCVTRDWKWWRRMSKGLTSQCSVECLRLFDKSEYQRLFGQSTRAAKLIRAVETCFPRLLARASAYCLVDMRKPASRDEDAQCEKEAVVEGH